MSRLLIATSIALLAPLVLLAPFVAGGCGGDQRTAAQMEWSTEDEKAPRPLRETELLNPPGATEIPDGGAFTWVGVRHDLMIAPSTARKARCSCLAVEVGDAGDSRFQWRGKMPEVGEDALVVAVSARGVECPGGSPDETRRRASISGVVRDGQDVVVQIEELREGRPIASGAIIAKPGAGGSVYVRSVSPKLPYARSLEAQRCKVF
jgi:hypothetical protein